MPQEDNTDAEELPLKITPQKEEFTRVLYQDLLANREYLTDLEYGK